MAKAGGWLLLVLGLAVAGYGVALAVVGTLPGAGTPVAWAGALVLGLLLVTGGILMLAKAPKMGPAAQAPAPAPPPLEQVEIKRTEMRWADQPKVADASSDRLDAARQKLQRLKVQWGLGEISNESYKRMSADLEKDVAELEKAELDKV